MNNPYVGILCFLETNLCNLKVLQVTFLYYSIYLFSWIKYVYVKFQ